MANSQAAIEDGIASLKAIMKEVEHPSDHLEHIKVRLTATTELLRAAIEREKARADTTTHRWWAATFGVPLLVAAISALIGFYAQAERARADFRIKAAEIVMASGTPAEIIEKAEMLMRLFPNEFDEHFLAAFLRKEKRP